MATQAGPAHSVETHQTLLGRCPACENLLGFVVPRTEALPSELTIEPHRMNIYARCDQTGAVSTAQLKLVRPPVVNK